MKGIIFDIQRCCCDDGPGVRTTVFLKGCNLRCAWCHNPESLRKEPQLRYLQHLCGCCERCLAVCPNGVHSFDEAGHHVDFSRCTGCGACVKVCPGQAVQVLGYEATAEEVMRTVLRDRAYYETSGGGLTVSGGEPTMQPDFLLELLSLAKARGIHTCLETNGYIPAPLLPKLMALTDLFLLDYKLTDRAALQSYTLAGGELWNNCLKTLQAQGKPVILRLPIIPGINDTDAHLRSAAELAKAHSCIGKVQVMPYHTIGEAKWAQLGYDYSLAATPGATPEQKAAWQQKLESFL